MRYFSLITPPPPGGPSVGISSESTMPSSNVADAEARTTGYMPLIGEALATQRKSSSFSLENSEVYRGKVRDVIKPNAYPGMVILVATGRQSAFDRHLATVPFKGVVLNKISLWWFSQTRSIVPNHVLASPEPSTLIARKTKVFAIEFVVRGYMTGSTDTSMWTHYKKGSRLYCGISLPDGMVKNQKLETPLVTPTTKDEHDAPISPADIVESGRMTQEEWDACSKYALALFAFGQKVAEERGLILVDTKYEFGKTDKGDMLLVDEIHTPDSSRYWLAESYAERFASGKEPENIDKEFLRLWYRERCDPYKDETIPDAPDDLVKELSRRYILLYELITGELFDFEENATLPEEDRAALVRKSLESLNE